MKIIKKIISKLPIQWWVKQGHWNKTTWKYVIIGKHKGNELKLSHQ